jgi:hypothetical protein
VYSITNTIGDVCSTRVMSFMPNVGAKVRLRDGRVATVSKVTPRGDDDRVVLDDGSDLRITAWDIDEIITELTS